MTDKLGPTGEFPNGKLDATDEGALRMAVSQHGNEVRIDFGSPVAWVAMSPQQAVHMAELIVKHARAAAKRVGVPLVVTL